MLSLCELCVAACVGNPYASLVAQHPEKLMDIDTDKTVEVQYTDIYDSYCKLRARTFLPESLCELLFEKLLKQNTHHLIGVFADTSKCRMKKLNLSISSEEDALQDQQLISKLFHHPLQEINLTGYELLPTTLTALNHCASSLKILDLSSASGLKNFVVLKTLKSLVKLNLQHSDIAIQKQHLEFIGALPNLACLDLSNTSVDDTSLEALSCLGRTLTWLSLSQCEHITDEEQLQKMILKLKNLRHLDLSKNPSEQDDGKDISYPIVTEKLLLEISSLPKLISLDISGSTGLTLDDLQPFNTRKTKLDFFGLFSASGLSYQSNLPAEKVSGEANEEKILTALEIYTDRIKFVGLALRKLFSLASRHGCEQIERCIKVILKVMQSFKKNNSIHIAATASLYHLSRENHPANSDNMKLRKDIILTILESMENLSGVLQLQKNSCLTLCNFKIPTDLEFQFFRVAGLLLAALRNHKDDYLRRIAIMLFNAIVCQNAGGQKKEIGLRGAIEIIIQIIKEKIDASRADDLMETCWSSLWNITDETPDNCLSFLDHDGMELFVDCLNLFPEAVRLHRNMMGLMGNVGEVKFLRPRLMQAECIDLFMSMLSETDCLEIKYNAAGLLSHLLSDGEDAWKLETRSRDACMQKIIDCIDTWDINADRNINYRSFKPIISLLVCFHAPAAQHWAAWALANLTRVYPHKYCKLVENEGGLELLRNVLETPHMNLQTKELSKMVIDNCQLASGSSR